MLYSPESPGQRMCLPTIKIDFPTSTTVKDPIGMTQRPIPQVTLGSVKSAVNINRHKTQP